LKNKFNRKVRRGYAKKNRKVEWYPLCVSLRVIAFFAVKSEVLEKLFAFRCKRQAASRLQTQLLFALHRKAIRLALFAAR
jgi:hypothetical protein